MTNEDSLCTMITNERQASELHMVRRRRNEKWQLTTPEPVTSRPITNTLAAKPRSPPACIDSFPSKVLVWACSIQSIL